MLDSVSANTDTRILKHQHEHHSAGSQSVSQTISQAVSQSFSQSLCVKTIKVALTSDSIRNLVVLLLWKMRKICTNLLHNLYPATFLPSTFCFFCCCCFVLLIFLYFTAFANCVQWNKFFVLKKYSCAFYSISNPKK